MAFPSMTFKSFLGLSQDKNNNKSSANRQFFMILAVIKLVKG